MSKYFFFLCHIFFWRTKCFQRSVSSSCLAISKSKSHVHAFEDLAHRSPDLSKQTLIVFNMEEALLKSSSLFPYFMLVAFEAGILLRAVALFLLYPLIVLVSEEAGLKVMVMVCFCGIKKESFRIGSAVLPKFFLEEIALESFEVLLRAGNRRVCVSSLPRVLIEDFLKDYLEIDVVIGRELKEFGGYFLGLMEEKHSTNLPIFEEHCGQDITTSNFDVIGVTSFNKYHNDQKFSHCKDVYLVRNSDKRTWKNLPREKYPKKLVFHDGRLAILPTPLNTLAIFMWAPVGFALAIFRMIVGISLSYHVSSPLLAFTGLQLTVTKPQSDESFLINDPQLQNDKSRGVLYVCNHRTLLDPLYLCFALKKKLHVVTYSLSKVSEIISPIKTVRLTRNREQDQELMKSLLNQGDLVVCPEGTTCREPYLLRFSPLFTEISDEIVPVAIDSYVSMFHGTTAGGLKSLDPLFFFLNPSPSYTVQFLEKVSSEVLLCRDGYRSMYVKV